MLLYKNGYAIDPEKVCGVTTTERKGTFCTQVMFDSGRSFYLSIGTLEETQDHTKALINDINFELA